ncbi:MAG TPA: hypothetical protein VF698_15965 [Thermoanaerobaculia bacterium]
MKRTPIVMFAIVAVALLALPVAAQVGPDWTAVSGGAQVYTTNTNANVGVGTTNPDTRLTFGPGTGGEIFRYNPNPTVRLLDFDFNHFWNAVSSRNGAAMRIDLRTDQPTFSWAYRAANQAIPPGNETVQMVLDKSGNLGIGTVNPTRKLDVVGNANVSGTLTGGSIAATYQDVAEWVPSDDELAPATVVVLDPAKSNHVTASGKAYDSSVAGVISAQPGILLGVGGNSQVKVATTGRVKVRVDATKAPIKIGDLLVTSDEAGVAMKSIPVDMNGVQFHRPGTVLGKALEPLSEGKGEILVLLSLQ